MIYEYCPKFNRMSEFEALSTTLSKHPLGRIPVVVVEMLTDEGVRLNGAIGVDLRHVHVICNRTAVVMTLFHLSSRNVRA